jgi:tRNA/rRNA methyltransferase
MKTRFVLIQTSHAGNVGAVARAMKVMGFEDLVLVQPRWADVLTRPEAIERASGAADVLVRARVVPTLAEALEGIDHVCATAMTPRDFGPPTLSPRTHFEQLRAEAAPKGVAFLFGSERFGMGNQDVWRSHVCLSIPQRQATDRSISRRQFS